MNLRVWLTDHALLLSGLLLLCVSSVTMGQATVTAPRAPMPTPLNTERGPLDTYIAAPDDAYSWKLVDKQSSDQATIYIVHLVSQSWLRPGEVDRTLWEHSLVIVKPHGATANTALMFVGGGSNDRDKKPSLDPKLAQIALATKSVVAELGMVPNQPLTFHGDGQPRKEDDLIAYCWGHFIDTGDTRWLPRMPMVKSVVRAMDTVQALLASEEGGKLPIDRFVVAGGSKRGWTTWMTAAADSRVVAIMPIVIDVLNMDVSMRHHYSAYGFWAPAIDEYVKHRIMDRRNAPRYAELIRLEDPFAYRNRYTMPKCVINAAGDQFFLPDSSQFYFDELPGEKHLCYVPNADHSLNDSNALDTLVAFHYAIVNGVERPEFRWSFDDARTIRVQCGKQLPRRVLLWQATNENARDFRVETLGRVYQSEELKPAAPGEFVAQVDEPEAGWKAYFVQLEFDVGAPRPLRMTTPVRVVPDELPFEDSEPPLSE